MKKDLSWQKKELENLKIGQLRFPCLANSKKNEQSLRDRMGAPEGEEKEKEAERIFEEIMSPNFPNWMKIINLHIQEVQQGLRRVNSKRSTFRHILIKLLKVKHKDRVLKVREQLIT